MIGKHHATRGSAYIRREAEVINEDRPARRTLDLGGDQLTMVYTRDQERIEMYRRRIKEMEEELEDAQGEIELQRVVMIEKEAVIEQLEEKLDGVEKQMDDMESGELPSRYARRESDREAERRYLDDG